MEVINTLLASVCVCACRCLSICVSMPVYACRCVHVLLFLGSLDKQTGDKSLQLINKLQRAIQRGGLRLCYTLVFVVVVGIPLQDKVAVAREGGGADTVAQSTHSPRHKMLSTFRLLLLLPPPLALLFFFINQHSHTHTHTGAHTLPV